MNENWNEATPAQREDENMQAPLAETPAQEAQGYDQPAEPQTETAQAPYVQQQEQYVETTYTEVPPQAPYAQAEEPQTPFQTPVRQTEPVYTAPPTGEWQNAGGATPPPPPLKNKKKKGHGVVIALGSVAAACLLFAGGAMLGSMFDDGNGGATTTFGHSNSAPTMQISSKPSLDPDNYDVVNGLAGEEIYKKVNASIVSVIATSLEGTGSGSGVIMSEDGYIITNAHVIDGADQVAVQLSDGTRLTAKVVGSDTQTDLAVIKVSSTTNLEPAEFGDSDELQPGEYAYAIGSPGGVELANTITGGRISAINRDITIDDRVMTLIQTDASINPGNSGGALINKYGQVVGITSAKLGISYYEGLGFAIPINTAKDIVDELISTGYIAGRPSIGITGQNISEQMAQMSNLPQGVYVNSIDERAKAASEGLLAGDIITEVQGQTITTMDEINAIKEDMKAGEKLKIKVYRASTGEFVNLTITLTDTHDLEDDSTAQQEQAQQEQQPQRGANGYSQYDGEDPFSQFFNW